VRACVCLTIILTTILHFNSPAELGCCIFYGRTGLCYILALRVVVAERHTPARSWNPGPESQMQQHSRCKNTAAVTEEESSVRLSRFWNPGPESQISRSWNPSRESQIQQHPRSWNPGPESQMQQHPTRADCVRPSRLSTSLIYKFT
jgi:hypothetical protein